MYRNIHQALKPSGAPRLYPWDACNRVFLESVIPNKTEPADPFRYQQRAIRQERNGPRLLEMLREDDYSQLSFLGGLDVDCPPRQVRGGPVDRSGCVA